MKKIFEDMHLEDYVVPIKDFKLFGGKADFPAPDSEQGRMILKTAEKFIDKEISILPASLFMLFSENGNRSDYEDVYFERRWILLNFLMAECIEKKGRFLKKLIDVAWAITEETTWIISAHYYKGVSKSSDGAPNLPNRYDCDEVYIDLFAAETAALLALVYYLLKKEITEAKGEILLEKILYEIDKRVMKPYLRTEEMNWMGLMNNRVNNWSTWITSNILLVTATTVEDIETRKKFVAKASRTMDNFVFWYGDDGGCDEGPGYWDAAGGGLFDALEIVRDMTGCQINVFDKSIKPIMEYICKINIDGRYYISFGDCHAEIRHSGKRIFRIGECFDSEVMRNFGQRISETSWEIGHMPYRKIHDILTEIYPINENLSDEFVFLPDLQLCGIRETNKSDEGFYLWLKGGHNGENHNHNDVGSFGVYLDGKPLLIDMGSGEYTAAYFNPKTRYSQLATRSIDHNLPVIGRKGQMPGREYTSDFFETDEQGKWAKVGMKNAYENRDEIVKLNRTATLKDGIVSVTDEVALSQKMPVEFRFYTVEKPSVTESGVVKLGNKALLKYDKELKVETAEVTTKEHPMICKHWKKNAIYMVVLSMYEADSLKTEFIIEKINDKCAKE